MGYFLLIVTLIVGIFQIDKLFPEKFKLRPWITFGMLIVLTVTAFIVESNNRQEAEINKKLAKNERDERDHIRDSIADDRVKKSNTEILTGIGDAIGKYSLGYDSAKRELVALNKLIKDSVNGKTTIIQGDNPYISFDDSIGIVLDYLKNDSMAYFVNIRSYSAGSIMKQAIIYTLTSKYEVNDIMNDLEFNNKGPLLAKNVPFFKNGGFGQKFSIYHGAHNIRSLVVFLRVSFADSYGKNFQEIERVGVLDVDKKKFSEAADQLELSVKNFLKRIGTY
ncbi:MAG TPA: hypothetical protein VIJ75_01330 [Hanamia sp.]